MVDYLDSVSSYLYHGSIACTMLEFREQGGCHILTILKA